MSKTSSRKYKLIKFVSRYSPQRCFNITVDNSRPSFLECAKQINALPGGYVVDLEKLLSEHDPRRSRIKKAQMNPDTEIDQNPPKKNTVPETTEEAQEQITLPETTEEKPEQITFPEIPDSPVLLPYEGTTLVSFGYTGVYPDPTIDGNFFLHDLYPGQGFPLSPATPFSDSW